MNADERRLNEITERVIGCAFVVANELGVGFLEKVYENSLFVELTLNGLKAEQQKAVAVRYRSSVVGQYFADILVEGSVLIEIKHCAGIDDAHIAQCLNYLRATGIRVCLLINFGKPKIEIKRLVHQL